MSIIADPNGSSVPAEGSVVASMWGSSQVIDSALYVVWMHFNWGAWPARGQEEIPV